MLLVVDVGNTQTVIGVYREDVLVDRWRLATVRAATADELRVSLTVLFGSAHLSFEDIDRAVLACVVPQLTGAWCEAALTCMGTEMLLCTAEAAGALFASDYPNPREIGADRVADAVAIKALYGAPGIVVDFGTATNIEIIDRDGMFIGGIIAPGLQTSAQTLFAAGAQLPAIALEAPHSVIGRNTVHAMQSGIVFGEVARIEGLLRRVFSELGYTAPVIATGGLAVLVADQSELIDTVNTELTLEGLRLIAEHHD